MLRKISRERAFMIASALDSTGRSEAVAMPKNGRKSGVAQGDAGFPPPIENEGAN